MEPGCATGGRATERGGQRACPPPQQQAAREVTEGDSLLAAAAHSNIIFISARGGRRRPTTKRRSTTKLIGEPSFALRRCLLTKPPPPPHPLAASQECCATLPPAKILFNVGCRPWWRARLLQAIRATRIPSAKAHSGKDPPTGGQTTYGTGMQPPHLEERRGRRTTLLLRALLRPPWVS